MLFFFKQVSVFHVNKNKIVLLFLLMPLLVFRVMNISSINHGTNNNRL